MSGAPLQTLVLAGFDAGLNETLRTFLEELGYRVQSTRHFTDIMLTLQEAPPELLLLAWSPASALALDAVKHDRAFGHLPVLILLQQEHVPGVDWSSVSCDDFITLPVNDAELAARVALCIERSNRDINANPLTGLPGNLTIMREAARRLAMGNAFAMGYVDLDHFKAFNDKYGFERGDQVLRMSARIMVNAMRKLNVQDGYVGHVGGDDFILMVPSERTTEVCEAIIADFDLVVRDFYDDEDRETGAIQSINRQGAPQTFPLMGCSIAVVDSEASGIQHVGALSARAAEVKKLVKQIDGSVYMIDRRG